MPYEGENPPYSEPDVELDESARAVIGAAIEVHRRMGPGLEESLYSGALCIELRQRQIPFERQVEVPVSYRDELVGKRRLDLLVGGRLVVELKAVEMLTPLHAAQVRTYLKITNLKLGLLINFNSIILKDGIKRVINPT
jgi:GxxExxY protein